tara:strand:+ start:870 stop:1268 length:399 start_codon:yes stop_codon:yes gene_type:complete
MEKKLKKINLIKDSDDMFFELMGSEDNKGDFKKMMEIMQKKYVMSFSFFHSLLFLINKETKKHLNEKERDYLKQLFGMELSGSSILDGQIISEMLLGKIKYDPIKKKFYETNRGVRLKLIGERVYENDKKRH